MLRILISFLIFLFIHNFAISQYHIIENGRIVFERKINTYAILPNIIGRSDIVSNDALTSYYQKYKNDNPQFWVDSFQLYFNKDSTFYEPAGKVSPFLHGTGVPMAEKNQVFTYLASFKFISEKNAVNERRVISDTLTKIYWKLTDETRDIAGYECRRANGLINDSIYIVAFYTDAIKTKGGPELFNGLPGMILGLAIPHFHISYFAIRIESILPEGKMPIPIFVNQVNKIRQLDYFNEMIYYLKEKKLDREWIKMFIRL
ncbi:MAG: GLPGLI family protein [Sediminibacterium sp.]|nr:GLPGLI family protein [Sediminibacterium sp.]